MVFKVRSWCSRFGRGVVAVRSWCGRGMLAARLRHARCTVEARSRFGRGAVEVCLRCGRGMLAVRSSYASSMLTGAAVLVQCGT